MVDINRRPCKYLTATQVNTNLKLGKYFDGYGLFLKVDKNGAKRWLQHLTIHGKRRELGLGAPAYKSLSKVRQEALENCILVKSGGDPLKNREANKLIPSFIVAARKYHETLVPSFKSASHAKQWLGSLERHAEPKIGIIKVTDLTLDDFLAVLEPIWTTKRETAEKLKQRMNAVMIWVITKQYRPDNPMVGIEIALPKDKKVVTGRKALPYEQIHDCIKMIHATSATIATKLCLPFIILTAVRSNEARLATWDEIDLASRVWSIPKERMKTPRPHRIPLTSEMIKLLRKTQKVYGRNGYLFPGSKTSRPLSDTTLSKLIKENGYVVDVHGFRTTFRTYGHINKRRWRTR